MFNKYYNFINQLIEKIGVIDSGNTLSNYLKSIVTGLLIMIGGIIFLTITSLLLIMPYLAYNHFVFEIYKEFHLTFEGNNLNKKNKKDLIAKFTSKVKVGLLKFVLSLIIFIPVIIPTMFIVYDFFIKQNGIIIALLSGVFGIYVFVSFFLLFLTTRDIFRDFEIELL